jgi:hypothetical protein
VTPRASWVSAALLTAVALLVWLAARSPLPAAPPGAAGERSGRYPEPAAVPAAAAPRHGEREAAGVPAVAGAAQRSAVPLPVARLLLFDVPTQLPRAGLAVRVRAPAGDVEAADDLHRWFDAEPLAAGTTDARGVVALALSPGTYVLELVDAFAFLAGDGKVTLDGGGAPIEVPTYDGGCVHGTALDAAGHPVAGASVFCMLGEFRLFGGSVQLPAAPQWGSAAALRLARTAADGSFLLAGMPPDRAHVLACWKEGFAPVQTGVPATAVRAVLGLRPILLEPGLALELRLRDERGSPVGGARVVARPGRGVAGGRREARSDADGCARVTGLARGVHRVTVSCAGREAASFELEAPGGRDVLLEPGKVRPRRAR